jgi:hypothetical protein
MSHYHRRAKIRRYISSGKYFFWRAISVYKTIGNFVFIFPIDIATDYGITDERKADGRILSVMTSVNKLPMKS